MDDVHHHKNELTSIKNPSQFTIFLNIDLRIHRKIPGQKKNCKLREFTVFIQEKESVEELLFHFLSMNQISEDVFYQCKSREDFFLTSTSSVTCTKRLAVPSIVHFLRCLHSNIA